MQRRKNSPRLFDNYINESIEIKEGCQEMVFYYYWDRNNSDMVATMQDIRRDISKLLKLEQYERCQLLKDIIDRFE